MEKKLVRWILLCLVISIIAAFPVVAQDDAENFIGVKGGVSIPQLSGGDDNILSRDFKSRVAPNFGAFFEAGVTSKFSIQTEVNFAGQGGKRTGVQPITQALPGLPPLPPGQFLFANFENVAELNYLEVPVLAKYRFGNKDKTRVYVNGGVFYGRLLSAKTKTSGTSEIFVDEGGTTPLQIPIIIPNQPPMFQQVPPVDFTATTDIENDVNKNNFGFTGGGGVEIPHKKNYFFIDARVYRGIVNIQRDTVANGASKTGNLVVSVGYAFNIK